jgi:hypothetical protein
MALTQAEKDRLKNLAIQVRSDFKTLQESEIIGRIILITGVDLNRALRGYDMLSDEGLLVGLVDRSTAGKFRGLLAKFPNLLTLCDSLQLVPQKITLLPYSGFMPPKRQDPKAIIAALNLPQF